MSDASNDQELETLITQWHEASRLAKEFTAKELGLRKQIFETAFGEKVGKHKRRLPYGMALLGEQKINYSVDRPVMESMMKDPELVPVLNEVLSHSPKLKEGAWKKMTANERGRFSDLVTEKLAAPTIEIKAAADVKW